MQTIYVGMALTDAPEEFRTTFQAELKTALRKISDVEVLDFVGLEKGTAADVYEYDRKCTEDCDLLVAICDHASIGLGMEVVFRHSTKKPLLLFAHKDSKVTRMLLGFAEGEGYVFTRYENVDEIVSEVKKEIEKFS